MATRQDSLTAALTCHHAGDQRLRPYCQGVATVAYGPISLCASCDRMRSAVGRGIVARPVPGAALSELIHAAERLSEAETVLADAVGAARRDQASWTQIGDALGITRQAAQQRWGTRPGNDRQA